MSTSSPFPQAILNQIKEKGLQPQDVQAQLERFRKGFPDLEIDRPATIGDGILRIPDPEEKTHRERFEQAQKEGRIMKFVPASGAASRMFKSLQTVLNDSDRITRKELEARAGADGEGDQDAAFTLTFLDNLETFAFYEDLVDVLKKDGLDAGELLERQDYHTLLSYILEEKGLGLASLPKALIPFHRYEDHMRAPLEEHLVEALAYTRAENGAVRIHFTISPEHKEAFDRRLESVRSRFETGGASLQVETSFQKPETDTLAADPDDQPFLDDDGNAVFRPGGHGALLVNLEELKGDIVFIKNIDNVVPDRIKDLTYRYKKLIGGYLLSLRDSIHFYLKELDQQGPESRILEEIVTFVKEELYVGLPDDIAALWDSHHDAMHEYAGNERAPRTSRISPESSSGTGPGSADQYNRHVSTRKKLVQWLHDRLNRPIRVCGMVKNEGEPGGGPFIVRHDDGSSTLQIVESAQIDMDDPEQVSIFTSSTHFNPVDLACSLRDYQGRPFKLEDYRDPETGFISEKSFQGRDLKALELPGLWNGSMARWNTVFIEVPADTFHPVKTVNDLLREEHRN
ncbi:MAG: DUF4301 family protein [Bacteroidota bacterium]